MVKTITRDDLRHELDPVLERYGMSFEEFANAGRANQLEDEPLREAWFIVGPAFSGR